MEPLQARILIQHVKGATIAYLYTREAFDLLKIERHTYDNSQFIEVGNVIEYDDQKYIVKSINVKMEEHLNKMDTKYGINVYSPTDPIDFNIQIGIFVEKAE